jgi:hypothetical protein
LFLSREGYLTVFLSREGPLVLGHYNIVPLKRRLPLVLGPSLERNTMG